MGRTISKVSSFKKCNPDGHISDDDVPWQVVDDLACFADKVEVPEVFLSLIN